LNAVLSKFAKRNANIVIAQGQHPNATILPMQADLHPVIGPIAIVQSFYALVNALSVQRGYDPDHPEMLKKVTETR
jgi:glutamine---fructose-6-phosphate transaminase (isomerizing)